MTMASTEEGGVNDGNAAVGEDSLQTAEDSLHVNNAATTLTGSSNPVVAAAFDFLVDDISGAPPVAASELGAPFVLQEQQSLPPPPPSTLVPGSRQHEEEKAAAAGALPKQTEQQQQQHQPEPLTLQEHRALIEAIFRLGVKHASPSVILDAMILVRQQQQQQHGGEQQLNSERVKSRLQKYRNNADKNRADFLTEYDAWLEILGDIFAMNSELENTYRKVNSEKETKIT